MIEEGRGIQLNKRNQKDVASSVPTGIGWGTITALSLILAGSFVTGKLLDTERIRWENVGYWVMVILLLSSFTGSVTACRKIKRKFMQTSLITGCVVWLFLLACTALLFGGQYAGVGVIGGLILSGSCSAGLWESNRQHKRKTGKRYRNGCKVIQKIQER